MYGDALGISSVPSPLQLYMAYHVLPCKAHLCWIVVRVIKQSQRCSDAAMYLSICMAEGEQFSVWVGPRSVAILDALRLGHAHARVQLHLVQAQLCRP